jgi:hypothetical protein
VREWLVKNPGWSAEAKAGTLALWKSGHALGPEQFPQLHADAGQLFELPDSGSGKR